MNCAGCLHRDRDALDAQLVQGVPYRSIAASFDLSLGSISRHKRHVREMVQGRSTVEMNEHGSDLLQRVQKLADEATLILETAKTEKNLKAATAAICAAVRTLELIGRLDGSLAQPHAPGLQLHLHKTVNVTNYGDDKEIAALVAEATAGFNPAVIERFKQLAACNVDAPPVTTP